MDIQHYIASGIIEQYVLGMTTPQETKEFEDLCRQYPELQTARLDFEMALEKKAFAGAIPPPAELKEQVLELIGQESALRTVNDIITGVPQATPLRKLPTMRWAVAICIVLTLGFLSFIYIIYNQNQQLENDIVNNQQRLEQIDQQKKLWEESTLPDNSVAKQVKVFTPETVPATINVYWDSTNQHVYLVIHDLAKLPVNEKYQLWSVEKGKYNSLGLFDAPLDDRLILRLNDAQQADAFAISISRAIPLQPGTDRPDSSKE